MEMLPECMQPDGANSCKAYQELYEENIALKESVGQLKEAAIYLCSIADEDSELFNQIIDKYIKAMELK